MASKRMSQPGASANARQAVRTKSGPAASSRPRTRTAAKSADASARPSARAVYRWWLAPAVIVGVLVLFVITYYPVARVQYSEVRQRSRLQTELTAIQQRNKRLSTQVARLKTPEGVEEEARTQLGMVKAGESVGVVLDGDEATATTPAGAPRIDSDRITQAPAGPWTAFWDAVFGVKTQ
jgi:hypothetical protein